VPLSGGVTLVVAGRGAGVGVIEDSSEQAAGQGWPEAVRELQGGPGRKPGPTDGLDHTHAGSPPPSVITRHY